jgi:glycosyltransferase involved in cell wall biosynthesis
VVGYARRIRNKLAHPVPKIKRRLKAIAKRVLRYPSQPAPAHPGGRASVASIAYSAAAGTPWQAPLFSIVLPAHLLDRAQQEPIAAALKQQTLQSFELVVWDRDASLAWRFDEPDQPWRVAISTDLGATLLGKYACVATPAVEWLPPNYFEINALALESQDLDLVINSFDPQEQAQPAFASRRMPGTDVNQWPLTVARAEALDESLAFAIDRIPRRPQGAHVAGRLLLHHPIPALAGANDWSHQVASAEYAIAYHEHYLLVRAGTQSDWGQVPLVLHPIDSVVRATSAPAKHPRALVLFPFIAVGGAEQLTLDVLMRLRDRFELLIATVEPKDPSIGSMVGEYQRLTPHVYVLPELLPHHLNFSALSYLIEGYGIETVFVANGANWIYDAAASLRQRFPRLHMVNQVYDHRIGWIDRYDQNLVRVFDRHVAPNQSIIRAYEERGVARASIDLIYHGMDTAAFDPAAYDAARIAELRGKLGLPTDKPVIAFLARMHPQKRPADFIMLAQRFQPSEASFLLVGDGPLNEQIDEQIRRANMPHLYRLPFFKPFVDILAVTDLVVIPSEYEGLPLVLLNAQAMGKPVVATDVGAIREVLEYTQGGVVIEHIGDVPAFERGVRALLAAPPDASQVRQRIHDRFDVEQVAARYGVAIQKP